MLERFSEYLTLLSPVEQVGVALSSLPLARGEPPPPLIQSVRPATRATLKLPTCPLLQHRGKTMLAPYIDYVDGCGNPIPNVCLKVPTGGGKTIWPRSLSSGCSTIITAAKRSCTLGRSNRRDFSSRPGAISITALTRIVTRSSVRPAAACFSWKKTTSSLAQTYAKNCVCS